MAGPYTNLLSLAPNPRLTTLAVGVAQAPMAAQDILPIVPVSEPKARYIVWDNSGLRRNRARTVGDLDEFPLMGDDFSETDYEVKPLGIARLVPTNGGIYNSHNLPLMDRATVATATVAKLGYEIDALKHVFDPSLTAWTPADCHYDWDAQGSSLVKWDAALTSNPNPIADWRTIKAAKFQVVGAYMDTWAMARETLWALGETKWFIDRFKFTNGGAKAFGPLLGEDELQESVRRMFDLKRVIICDALVATAKETNQDPSDFDVNVASSYIAPKGTIRAFVGGSPLTDSLGRPSIAMGTQVWAGTLSYTGLPNAANGVATWSLADPLRGLNGATHVRSAFVYDLQVFNPQAGVLLSNVLTD